MVAVASFLAARACAGEWHVRIDDLDPQRTVPTAADDILRTLEAHALTWDGPVVFQSTRRDAYLAALDALRRSGHAYRCTCTRRQIMRGAAVSDDGPRYPGTCRDQRRDEHAVHAWRLRTDNIPVTFQDAVLGPIERDIEAADGDFILWRSDGVPGYQLASTVDDADGGFTQIVRGADLLASSARQTLIRRIHALPPVVFAHLPLIRDTKGQKLAKGTGAPPVSRNCAGQNVRAALAQLGLCPPLDAADPQEILAWAGCAFRWEVLGNVGAGTFGSS